MASRRNGFSMNHPIVIGIALMAVVAAMSAASSVLKPLALAILLSFALSPLARRLEGLRLPRAAAVVLTVVLALGALGGVGYVVAKQLDELAGELPKNRDRIIDKVSSLAPARSAKIRAVQEVAKDVVMTLERPPSTPGYTVPVRVVDAPNYRQKLEELIGPYLEFVALGAFVLILVLFLMINREDLADRIISLFGNQRVSLTTRTMEEVGHRISRFLAMLATVNSTMGLVVGLGLGLIGVPYATLWGFLAAALRFIPYVGPSTAFALPLVYSIAHFDSLTKPLEVVALFGVLEVLANSFIEPVIYGRTTGVSALALLVAAMFWTWLWGPLGLLLSTPLTVCLAVLGKYVPSLGFFATLMGEEAPMEPDVRFYRRLLAKDLDGAVEIVEDALRQRPRAEVFDQILIPAMSRAERDLARDEIDEAEQAFLWTVITDVLDEIEGSPDLSLEALSAGRQGENPPQRELASGRILGLPSNDTSDQLALRMLGLLLAPSGVTIETFTESSPPWKAADRVAGVEPRLAIVSHVPPVGLTAARYLVRRLRARMPELPIMAGRWSEGGDTEELAEKLAAAGNIKVVFSLADARDSLLQELGAKAPVAAEVAHAGK